MAGVTAKSKVRRATSTHPMPQEIQCGELLLQSLNPRRQRFGGGLQTIHSRRPAAPSLLDATPRTTARPIAAAAAGRHLPYTAAVASPSGGRTTTKCSAPSPGDGSTLSPLPRQIGRPAGEKNGTSLPNSAAHRPTRRAAGRAANLVGGHQRGRRVADPPPKPAAAGIRLTSRNLAPRRTPARRRTNSTARTTRLSGPSGTSWSPRPPDRWPPITLRHRNSTCPVGSS